MISRRLDEGLSEFFRPERAEQLFHLDILKRQLHRDVFADVERVAQGVNMGKSVETRLALLEVLHVRRFEPHFERNIAAGRVRNGDWFALFELANYETSLNIT